MYRLNGNFMNLPFKRLEGKSIREISFKNQSHRKLQIHCKISNFNITKPNFSWFHFSCEKPFNDNNSRESEPFLTLIMSKSLISAQIHILNWIFLLNKLLALCVLSDWRYCRRVFFGKQWFCGNLCGRVQIIELFKTAFCLILVLLSSLLNFTVWMNQ